MADELDKIVTNLILLDGIEFVLASKQRQKPRKKAAWEGISDDALITPAANVTFHDKSIKT